MCLLEPVADLNCSHEMLGSKLESAIRIDNKFVQIQRTILEKSRMQYKADEGLCFDRNKSAEIQGGYCTQCCSPENSTGNEQRIRKTISEEPLRPFGFKTREEKPTHNVVWP